MTCTICEQVKGNKNILSQTENIAVLIAQEPATDGHLLIVPKQHAPIAEQVPSNILQEMFTKANELSTKLFEELGVQGTNIVLQNGLAAGQAINHVVLNVIPRKESDGLNLEWQPKQLTEQEMTQVETTIIAEGKDIGKEETVQPKTQEKEKPKEITEETIDDKENYQLKQLERIP